jgi:hypothetical protein
LEKQQVTTSSTIQALFYLFYETSLKINFKEATMAKFGKKSKKTVADSMHKFKRGDLRMGKSGKKVADRDQAVAIGLSEAREKGGKVPKK